jgi:hypothetical protein
MKAILNAFTVITFYGILVYLFITALEGLLYLYHWLLRRYYRKG